MLTNVQVAEIMVMCDIPELRKQSGMVYEVWQDGEVTLTKSGELYGKRSLHQIAPPISGPYSTVVFPIPGTGNRSVAVSREGLYNVLRAIVSAYPQAWRHQGELRYQASVLCRELDELMSEMTPPEE